LIDKKTIGILSEKETLLYKAHLNLLNEKFIDQNSICTYFNLSKPFVSNGIKLAQEKIRMMIKNKYKSSHINILDVNDNLSKYKNYYVTDIGLSIQEYDLLIRKGIYKVVDLVNSSSLYIKAITKGYYKSITAKLNLLDLFYNDEINFKNIKINDNIMNKILNTKVEDEFDSNVANILLKNNIYFIKDICKLNDNNIKNTIGFTFLIKVLLLKHLDYYNISLNIGLDPIFKYYYESIDILNLSVRLSSKLKKSGIYLIKDLINLNEKDFLLMGLSENSIIEIKDKLILKGLYVNSEPIKKR
jgi:hypothetical protein